MIANGFTDLDESMVSYKLTNLSTFQYYALRLMSLAKTVFNWKNLPDEVDQMFLEEFLLIYGVTVFAKEDVTGDFITLPAVPNGALNIYGVPTKWNVFGFNGFNMGVDAKDVGIIYDNYNRRPILRDILMFARRMEIIERTMDLNIQGQKTPYVLSGTKQQVKTLEDIYHKLEINAPVIFADKNFDISSAINVTPTTTPFVAADLQNIKRNIWNEAMTFLGVKNANTEKRERLLAFEAEGAQGMIESQTITRLKPRQEAVKRINKLFGLNIEVSVSDETVPTDPEMDDAERDAKLEGLEELDVREVTKDDK